jgi:hypothetical protein
VPYREDRKRDRCEHEEYCRPGGRFGEGGSGSTRAESCLAAHAPEGRRNVTAFAALQQHDYDQKKANYNVNGVNQANQNAHELPIQTGVRPAFLFRIKRIFGAEGGI